MPKKPPTTSVELRYPTLYIQSCMVNRYELIREDGFTLAHFGLVSRKGLLLDRFSCVFPEHTLQLQKENLVQYSDNVGLPKNTIPPWNAPARVVEDDCKLPVVDYVHVSHWADAHAEICFWSYSQGQLADFARANKKEPLIPWGLALVRCEIDLQREFLVKLYETTS